jgi:hypothetical protein
VIDLDPYVPAAGELGIYLRLRGLARFYVVFFKPSVHEPSGMELLPAPAYLVITPVGSDFTEQVLHHDLFTDAYQWFRPEDRPVMMAIVPQPDPDQPAIELFELDCVVPFVLPSPGAG